MAKTRDNLINAVLRRLRLLTAAKPRNETQAAVVGQAIDDEWPNLEQEGIAVFETSAIDAGVFMALRDYIAALVAVELLGVRQGGPYELARDDAFKRMKRWAAGPARGTTPAEYF